jgi:hypothetical protein
MGDSKRVVYLFGAGASQGCVQHHGSDLGILTTHLADDLGNEVRKLVKKRYPKDRSLSDLVNNVISGADIEQVITFLEESGSWTHRDLAKELRDRFRKVLNRRLEKIRSELRAFPTDLYAAVIDMHNVPGSDERLAGVLTLNYDSLLERAIRDTLGQRLDYGVRMPLTKGRTADSGVKVLKLHGSFDWRETIPITVTNPNERHPVWIPPGIQKAKGSYPFTLLWGQARELLACDVLRVVGCRLTSNDWDLISMLFITQHSPSRRAPYDIEIIDFPSGVAELRDRFPFLQVKAMPELEVIGDAIVAETIGGAPRPYSGLSDIEMKRVVDGMAKISNPFQYWLKHKAEEMFQRLKSIETPKRALVQLLEARI